MFYLALQFSVCPVDFPETRSVVDWYPFHFGKWPTQNERDSLSRIFLFQAGHSHKPLSLLYFRRFICFLFF